MESVGVIFKRGYIVAGRYKIEEWLGQGGMGVVFRATHLCTKRKVALKILLAPRSVEDGAASKPWTEAVVGSVIGRNPHIVDVFDAGTDFRTGVPYLAMDLLEGETLDKYVAQRGPISWALLRMLWLQLADALQQAHDAQVVHRDLKPSNLFLTFDRRGEPRLFILDFGIAKLLERGFQRNATPIGTPGYSAPEQLGFGARLVAKDYGFNVALTISPGTDIWAVGVITYELLTGSAPGALWADGDEVTPGGLWDKVATKPTPSAMARAGQKAALLPPGFDGWLEKCLEKNAADRWPSVNEAVRRLIELFDAEPRPSNIETQSKCVVVPNEAVIPLPERGIGARPELGSSDFEGPTLKLPQRSEPEHADGLARQSVCPESVEITRDLKGATLRRRANAMKVSALCAAVAMGMGAFALAWSTMTNEHEAERPDGRPPSQTPPRDEPHNEPIDSSILANTIPSTPWKSPRGPSMPAPPESTQARAWVSVQVPPRCRAFLAGEPSVGSAPIDNYAVSAGRPYVVVTSCDNMEHQKCWFELQPRERTTVTVKDSDLVPMDVVGNAIKPCSQRAD